MKLGKKIFIIVFALLLYGGSNNYAHAETSPYRSAGWVASEGNPPYTNLENCQQTDDKYCSRIGSTSQGAILFFGSFPDLESLGIPLNSVINELKIRIKGKSTRGHLIGIESKYNNKNLNSNCQKPADLIKFNLGSTDKTVDLTFPLTGTNGLINCIYQNNINFRNLTFGITQFDFTTWSADIDNFEIAFDYTPPAITPPPVVFPEGQKGTIWKIGPDKSNLLKSEALDEVLEVAEGELFNSLLKSDGTVWTSTGNNAAIQVKGENGVGFLSNVKKISPGLALKKDGTVWAFSLGQNAISMKLSDIIDIAVGGSHRLALTSSGAVYGWGSNSQGQVGIGCTGGNCSNIVVPRLINNFTDVKQISAGELHSLAVKNDGSVWGWGRSYSWELAESGLATSVAGRPSPVQITELANIQAVSTKVRYNFALNTSGEILEWGMEISKPKKIVGISNVTSISAGWPSFSPNVTGHAIKEDGTLWQLYINNIPPKQVPYLKDVVAVASGDQTAALAVINSNGEVLGDSTYSGAFLDLPFDYIGQSKTFEQVVYNPESWFDHEYPLQNILCCTFKVLDYKGIERNDAYRSHSGYDYAFNNGVKLNTSVLAAAAGSAELVLEKNSGGAGNFIKIDHNNGYQTWYQHLSYNNLVIESEDGKIGVEKGQKIGEVGMTGNTNGPHIHFSVFKDSNLNGSFDDDYPVGLVDPLGWDGDFKDPWTEYQRDNRFGSESVNLFTKLLKPIQKVAPKTGTEIVSKDLKLKISPDTLPVDFTIRVKNGPFEDIELDNKQFSSIVPSFFLEAFNSLNDKITQFLKNIVITYDYSKADLSNIKEETLKAYYYDDQEKRWIAVDSIVDLDKKIIIAEIDHFTQFAIMGETKDTISPATEVVINGDEAEKNIFNSDVTVELRGVDNEGGLGIQYVLYSLNNNEWLEYKTPIVIEDQGSYTLSYQSFDKANNKEERNKVEFEIDKTAPATISELQGVEGLGGWYKSDVTVSLNASDDRSGVAKTEYSLDSGLTYQQYTDQIVISSEGTSEVHYRSTDKAGNIESVKKLNLKIDKTPPSSLVYWTGSRGQDDWYRSDVDVSLNAIDEISGYKASYYSLDNGVNYVEYVSPIELNDESQYKILYYSVDNAGNSEQPKSIEFNIDKTPPEVEFGYDIDKREILPIGKDNLSPVNVTKSNIVKNKYLINIFDKAGNNLKLLMIDEVNGNNARISIHSTQYNAGNIVVSPKNNFSVKYKSENDQVHMLEQRWIINDVIMLKLQYLPNKSSTKIVIKNGHKVDAEFIEGVKLLKIYTINGEIGQSY